ncbi:hypothetical protein AKJ16_DCAP26729 [Drosera capensis]
MNVSPIHMKMLVEVKEEMLAGGSVLEHQSMRYKRIPIVALKQGTPKPYQEHLTTCKSEIQQRNLEKYVPKELSRLWCLLFFPKHRLVRHIKD